MKRKYENDQTVFASKKRRTSSMPLADKLTLYNLHGLESVNGPYCLRLDLGLAMIEDECDTCQDNLCTEKNENEVDKIMESIGKETKKKRDLYKIDALIRDIWQKSGSDEVDKHMSDDGVSVVYENVNHLSWFSIQLILHNSPVECFLAAKKKVTIKFSGKEKCVEKQNQNENNILREMLIACHRNVYHMLYSQSFGEDVHLQL